MIDRGVILRGFFVLLLLAAALTGVYVVMSDTDGTSGNFLEDDKTDSWSYGPIYEQPTRFGNRLQASRWVQNVPVAGGTFGKRSTRVIRIDIDGTGSIPEREVTLETGPAVRLFAPPRRERAEGVLHGMQRILEERDGVVRGFSLAEHKGDAQAAVIATVVRQRNIEHIQTGADKANARKLLVELSRELATHAYAWYHPQFQEVVLGPHITKGLVKWIRTPDKVTPAEGIFTAYVVLHELEHAVTPAGYDVVGLDWMEEGGADVMARWPGAAARTAKELGLPYPKRYEQVEYSTKRGGYPEWTKSLRMLLVAAGVDVTDPKQLDAGSELLQERELKTVPTVLAERIAKRNRLKLSERRALEREIRKLDGSVKPTRRLVAKYT